MRDESKRIIGGASEFRATLRIISCIAALGLAVALSVVLVGRVPGACNTYFAAIVDKHKRLVSLPSPKLVIIGGSSAVFGIDSRAIESAFGVPVVNMGLHAGVGLPFMLDEVENQLSRGDIVLLTPEYELLWGDSDHSMAKYIAMSCLADPWNYVTSAADYVRYYVHRAQEARKRLPRILFGMPAPDQAVYSYRFFNTFGDLEGDLAIDGKFDTAAWDPRQRPMQKLNDISFSRLELFIVRARQKLAVVAFAHPPLLDIAYRRDSTSIVRADTAVRSLAARTGMVVVSTIEDFLFAAADIYDTPYHLNASGRAKRMKRLISRLETAHLASILKQPQRAAEPERDLVVLDR